MEIPMAVLLISFKCFYSAKDNQQFYKQHQYNTKWMNTKQKISPFESFLTASSIAQWHSAGFECGRSRVQSTVKDRLLDSLVAQRWLRVREVPGSIHSQGPRHTKDVIKMVPVVPLFSTEHLKGNTGSFSRIKIR